MSKKKLQKSHLPVELCILCGEAGHHANACNTMICLECGSPTVLTKRKLRPCKCGPDARKFEGEEYYYQLESIVLNHVLSIDEAKRFASLIEVDGMLKAAYTLIRDNAGCFPIRHFLPLLEPAGSSAESSHPKLGDASRFAHRALFSSSFLGTLEQRGVRPRTVFLVEGVPVTFRFGAGLRLSHAWIECEIGIEEWVIDCGFDYYDPQWHRLESYYRANQIIASDCNHIGINEVCRSFATHAKHDSHRTLPTYNGMLESERITKETGFRWFGLGDGFLYTFPHLKSLAEFREL